MSQATLQFSDSGSWTPQGLQSYLTAAGPSALHGHLLLSTLRCFPADQSIVYKGTLTTTSTAVMEASSQDVVCKYREGDISGLEHEARIYREKLADLQGTHVPRFLGLFRGVRVDEMRREKDVACLILEYFHHSTEEHVLDRPIQTRVDIAIAMMHVHFAGVKQCDLEWDHFLVSDDSQVRIVDFDEAREHECEASGEIEVGRYEPSICELGCHEMWRVVSQLKLWTPTIISFNAKNFFIFSVADPEILAKRYMRYAPHHADDPAFLENVKREAKETLDRYWSLYGHRFKDIGDPREIMKAQLPIDREAAQKRSVSNTTVWF